MRVPQWPKPPTVIEDAVTKVGVSTRRAHRGAPWHTTVTFESPATVFVNERVQYKLDLSPEVYETLRRFFIRQTLCDSLFR